MRRRRFVDTDRTNGHNADANGFGADANSNPSTHTDASTSSNTSASPGTNLSDWTVGRRQPRWNDHRARRGQSNRV